MSACSVNSVNKNFLTLRAFRPMPTVESDLSRTRLCGLVRVHLTCIEPGHCEFRTCCDVTKEDEIATELRTNLLIVKDNQSTLLKTVVGNFCPSVRDQPGLLIVQQCQCSPPIPASGPVLTRI